MFKKLAAGYGISGTFNFSNLVHEFLDNAEQFANQVELMDNSLLDHPFVNEKYGTYLRNIEAVIEHSYYHLGQVSLIKKMVMEK